MLTPRFALLALALPFTALLVLAVILIHVGVTHGNASAGVIGLLSSAAVINLASKVRRVLGTVLVKNAVHCHIPVDAGFDCVAMLRSEQARLHS